MKLYLKKLYNTGCFRDVVDNNVNRKEIQKILFNVEREFIQ